MARKPTPLDPTKPASIAAKPRRKSTYTVETQMSGGVEQPMTVVSSKSEPDTAKTDAENTAEFLRESLEIFRSIAEDQNEIDIREQALKELKFKNGDQWPGDIRESRERKKRPIVTINKVKSAVRIVCNDMRQNRAAIKVAPVDGAADLKTAQILQGVVRHIEVNSMSDIAIDSACESQVTFGFGYVRLRIEYANPFSMDQEIYISRVRDPFSVYCGPSIEPDYSDMDDCFITEDLSVEQFRAIAPKSEWSTATEFTGIGDTARGWGTRDRIRVCERFWRTHEKDTLYRMNSGGTLLKSQIPDELMTDNAIGIKTLSDGSYDSRETEIPHVHWCQFTAVEVIATRDWPGMYIPIIPVLGDDTIIDGKRVLSGVVRDAMDPAMQYNYFRSLMTETLGLAPKSPYIMAEGQNEGRETMWKTSNSENYSVLFYKPISLNGQLAPPPQRQQSEPPIQAMVEAAIHYESDIKATTMVNDAKLGAKGNETSGTAINARKAQSDVSNFNYIDNRNRAIRHIGRQCLDLIPRVYSTRTIMRIVGEDEKSEMVNVEFDTSGPAYREDKISETDIKKIYNLSVGQYDVAIGIGEPYLSRRQEGFELLTKLVNSAPELMAIGGDIILKNSDIPGAQELAKRLYKALPANLKDSDETAIPPAIKQKFDEMTQTIEAQTEVITKLQGVIEGKQVEMQGHKEIKQIDVQGKIEQEQIKAKVKAGETQEKWMEAQLKASMERQSQMLEQQAEQFNRQFEAMMARMMGAIESRLSSQEHQQTLVEQDNKGGIDLRIQAAKPKPTTNGGGSK